MHKKREDGTVEISANRTYLLKHMSGGYLVSFEPLPGGKNKVSICNNPQNAKVFYSKRDVEHLREKLRSINVHTFRPVRFSSHAESF